MATCRSRISRRSQTKRAASQGRIPVTTDPPGLSAHQRAELLSIARRAIRQQVRGTGGHHVVTSDAILQAPGAAFITLTHQGKLRGCIGYVEAIKPLAEAVAHCAASAATGDPRFCPVTPEELSDLHLEISVLSPLRRIEDPREVQVGTHGLLISGEGRHGLLLPQVATEYRWDRETFLRQTCLKAGLPGDAWKRGAKISVFTVDHFSDGLPVEPAAS
jgi:AmmeMemoRadiSam system protein A